MSNPILYLDFDGVLHGSEVLLIKGIPTLKGYDSSMTLFCWAPILADILESYPTVEIRLSTSWVPILGFDYAKAQLPSVLQERITGSTWHTKHKRRPDLWHDKTRFEQIMSDVKEHGIKSWVALDDDGGRWGKEYRDHLVWTDGDLGLSDESDQMKLMTTLQRLTHS